MKLSTVILVLVTLLILFGVYENNHCKNACFITPKVSNWCEGGRIITETVPICGCQNVVCDRTPVVCPALAKICQDGSAVGMIGPNCEWAPCPGECICPVGYKNDGGICNPDCYYNTPRCMQPSIQCGAG
jgi:hypothetical protein